ncbi:Ubiquinone biosynthesis O-methyltransferase [Roseivivax jejudonensis]|uniref:Ubiquinone biosynthesis O-methyltransferase n=1 Tax=Roseivivax jejudonensis TaxID=1529041 RepID=A0A1X6ZRK8_9RHOB|nr:bifunctional 2-polyprenyl-6-hydroxyphenol methylase/3-demethylubiquinol 3-O-methyltransferase UbiG [Roseivivax jejudonensis]SLN57575.1 Ubiquinone biosynthesis O-methyltransferase [Roseivivax jejudonensis]
MTDTSVDPREVAKFEAMAAEWWDPKGRAAPLHAMGPCRLDYVAAQIAGEFGRDLDAADPLAGLSVLDIGCGGGLMSEPMARLGAHVTGIDAGAANIAAARTHAEAQELTIDYRAGTAEALSEGEARFDTVLAMEIVEHVPDPDAFVATAARLVAPGGLLIVSTVNRTARAFAAVIVGAEWVLRWLPRGTHDWNRFIRPDELEGMMTAGGLSPVDRKGMVPDLAKGGFRLSDRDLAVNYTVTARRDITA